MPKERTNQEKSQIEKEHWEGQMLGQIASLLVKENLISPEEQILFLSLANRGE